MSNLNLPNLNFYRLIQFVPRDGMSRKIGYETRVENVTDFEDAPIVVLRHHGSTIATMGAHTLTITTAHWNSRTTTDRLDRVVRAHDPRYRVRMYQGDTWLMLDGTRIVNMRQHPLVGFSRVNDHQGNCLRWDHATS